MSPVMQEMPRKSSMKPGRGESRELGGELGREEGREDGVGGRERREERREEGREDGVGGRERREEGREDGVGGRERGKEGDVISQDSNSYEMVEYGLDPYTSRYISKFTANSALSHNVLLGVYCNFHCHR